MLIRLKEPLDNYHQRRADAHGWLWVLTRRGDGEVPDFVEARSIATGVVCTLITFFTEEADDGP